MTETNLEKYRKDLDALVGEAQSVRNSLYNEVQPEEFLDWVLAEVGGDEKLAEEHIRQLKPFRVAYHHWYSEAVVVIKQLLPDRHADFVRLYERPKNRREITLDTYRIEDACQGIARPRPNAATIGKKTAISLITQQIAILESVKRRFESSLFDIKQLVQADLFDSELDTARGLLKAGFARAAGAIAGVVLEGHLKEVAAKHGLPKTLTTINPLNHALKAAGVIDQAQSRHIEFLGDVRNNCGHKRAADPKDADVQDLIDGVVKVIKTVF
ncbi:hypothetical protein [Pseudomonas sp.]|uniref:hypothetical protein n=1 Tax=Pseudomonas sp. TaxID=306 RepID=UPI001AFFB1E9|nr:hypothetical protein [Pseudomonas sp.]MBO9552131.1 hypothetical protein [Pseudomonas sp.]